MIFLYNLVEWLTILAAIAYIAAIIYSLFAKFTGRTKLPHLLLIITLPPILMLATLAILLFPLNYAAGKERYGQWTKKCGHEPVLGASSIFGPIYTAYIGEQAKEQADMASDYYCTFSDAGNDGYNPDPLLSKKDFLDAGYRPQQADVDYVNKDRPPENKLSFD